jgi:undecaprenyl pyrophosphate phosphatase UppP
MKTKPIVLTVLAGLVANLLLVNSAYAYLDPGTGSALLQGILAALGAIAVIAKLYWHRLLRFLGIRKTKIEPEQTATQVKQENSKNNEGA